MGRIIPYIMEKQMFETTNQKKLIQFIHSKGH